MLPDKYLFRVGKSPKSGTREFLNGTLLALLNALTAKGVDTKLVDFLGSNDAYIFRGENASLLALSRARFLPQPTICEYTWEEIKQFGLPAEIQTPLLIDDAEWAEALQRDLHCADPVTVAFPSAYFGLQGDQLTEAHRAVASLFLPESELQVEKKLRIVRVNPIFVGRDFSTEPSLCFVLLPFEHPYTDIYDQLIAPTVTSEGMTPLKSDDIFSTTSVIEDIWANINKATLIIAEISSTNPNVMYELGICHTVGKNVMMITQQPESIPFNFRHMRCYPYTNDIPGSEELRRNIRSVIQHTRATHVRPALIP